MDDHTLYKNTNLRYLEQSSETILGNWRRILFKSYKRLRNTQGKSFTSHFSCTQVTMFNSKGSLFFFTVTLITGIQAGVIPGKDNKVVKTEYYENPSLLSTFSAIEEVRVLLC